MSFLYPRVIILRAKSPINAASDIPVIGLHQAASGRDIRSSSFSITPRNRGILHLDIPEKRKLGKME
jgi:hypothetical protein